MSGVFKSVKKVFRSVGNFIKKYWKPIVIAAAVYFGGAYLMSAGGGSSVAAATKVGTSATHAGQVWRNAVSSMLSGGGAKASASAYADAVYKAKNLSVSNEVIAGANAVKGIRFMRDERGITQFTPEHIEDASQIGYEAMEVYRNNITQGSVFATTKTNEFLANKFEQTRVAVGASTMEGTTLGQLPTLEAGTRVSEEIVKTTDSDLELMAQDTGTVTPEDVESLGGEEIVGTEPLTDNAAQLRQQETDAQNKTINDLFQLLATGQSEQAKRDDALAKQNATSNMISLGIQGAGVLMSAVGEYQKGKASERIRTKKIPDKWKPPLGEFPHLDWKGLKL